jgi:hypothetical protein
MGQEPDVPRADAGIKVMRLRYAGTCACGQTVAKGEQAGYDTVAKKVVCAGCLAHDGTTIDVVDPLGVPVEPPPVASTAGGSLRRTHDQRAAARDARVRERFPRMGGFLLAVTPEPASMAAFKKGAEGEEKAARRIIEASGPDVLFLLNRSLGAGRRDGDIDMIAISAAGILVVDVKHYKDAKVEVRRSGGLFSARTEALYVGGRDKSAWLAGLDKQRDAVLTALTGSEDAADIPVSVALCFVDGDLPLFEHLSIGQVSIYGSRELGKRLKKATGPLDEQNRRAVLEHLSNRLTAA